MRDILNIKKFRGTLKELHVSSLCHKFAYRCHTVVEGLGRFDQHLVQQGVRPVV